MDDYAVAAQAFRQFCGQLPVQRLLLTGPEVHALGHLASQAIAEAGAEIARLKAQLDRYQGREVFYCTDANAPFALASVGAAPVGTVVRATDTGREWELTVTGWEPRT
jgi:predicted ATPase